MTGKHKGFAFIWYDIPEAAQLAIEVVSTLGHFSVNIKKTFVDELGFNVGTTYQSWQAYTGKEISWLVMMKTILFRLNHI